MVECTLLRHQLYKYLIMQAYTTFYIQSTIEQSLTGKIKMWSMMLH